MTKSRKDNKGRVLRAGDGSENILIERTENLKEVDLYMDRIDEMIERKRIKKF